MRIINKYFLREFLPSIFFGLLFYTSFFVITSFIEITELSLKNGIPFFKASFIIFLSFPYILTTTIPMATFFGILLGISKLQSQNEIFALFSLGLSKRIIYKEVFKIALFFLCIHLILSIYILPEANRTLVLYRIELLQSGLSKNIEPKTFLKAFPGKIIYIKNIKENKNKWEEIFITDFSQVDGEQYVYAKEGELYLNKEGNQIWLKLYNTLTISLKDEKSFQKNTSSQQDILLYPPLRQSTSYKTGVREKNLRELKGLFNDLNPSLKNKARVEFHKRFVLPALSFIFPFFALSLSLRKREKGSVKGYAFLISLIVILISYIFLIYNESLAVDGKLNPAFSMWSIPVFFFLTTLFFLLFPKREGKLKIIPYPSVKEKKENERKSFKKSSISFHLLDQYLFRFFIPYFLISVLAISSLFIIVDFAQIVDEINKNKVPLNFVLNYYIYSLPHNLYNFIIPLCILSSIAIGIAILEKNKEITALKALGVSLSRISLSLLILAFIIGITFFIFSEIYLPEINQKSEEYRDTILGKKNLPKFARFYGEDTYVASEKGWIYKYKTFDKKNSSILGFEGFNFSQQPEIFLIAREVYFSEGKWIVSEGVERRIYEDKIDFKKIDNEIYKIPDKPEVFSSIYDNPSNLNLLKLRSYISNLKRAGYKPYSWEVKLWQKIFYPLFILLIAFISIVFSFTQKSTHQIWGNLAKILFVGIIYWILIIFFGKMGEMQMLTPFLAAFSPNFLFMLYGLYYYLGIRE